MDVVGILQFPSHLHFFVFYFQAHFKPWWWYRQITKMILGMSGVSLELLLGLFFKYRAFTHQMTEMIIALTFTQQPGFLSSPIVLWLKCDKGFQGGWLFEEYIATPLSEQDIKSTDLVWSTYTTTACVYISKATRDNFPVHPIVPPDVGRRSGHSHWGVEPQTTSLRTRLTTTWAAFLLRLHTPLLFNHHKWQIVHLRVALSFRSSQRASFSGSHERYWRFPALRTV